MFPTLLGAAGGEGRRREGGRGGVGPAKSLCQFWRLAQDDETGGHAWLATSDEVDQVQDEVDTEWRLATGEWRLRHCGAARQCSSLPPGHSTSTNLPPAPGCSSAHQLEKGEEFVNKSLKRKKERRSCSSRIFNFGRKARKSSTSASPPLTALCPTASTTSSASSASSLSVKAGPRS